MINPFEHHVYPCNKIVFGLKCPISYVELNKITSILVRSQALNERIECMAWGEQSLTYSGTLIKVHSVWQVD